MEGNTRKRPLTLRCKSCKESTPAHELLTFSGECGICWTGHDDLRYEAEQAALWGGAA